MSVTTESPVATSFLQRFGTLRAVVGGVVGGVAVGAGVALAGAALPFVAAGAVIAGVMTAGGSAAYDEARERGWDDKGAAYLNPRTKPEEKVRIRQEMLASEDGRRALAARPRFGGAVLSAADPASLTDVDLGATFGQNALAEAMLATLRKPKAGTGEMLDREIHQDPARFDLLTSCATQIDPGVWNDKGKGIGARKLSLGPRVCQALWEKGDYDKICGLIDHGVDTSLAGRADPMEPQRAGIYSGFVQPLQHVLSKHLRDVAALDDPAIELREYNRGPAAGAKKILEKLESKKAAVSLTKWSDVTGSEMIRGFPDAPGTIWGFENVRQPYVQAAHETDAGAQPLRMMELWEAVGQTTTPQKYAELIENPETVADDLIRQGVETIRTGIARNDAKYEDIKDHAETYIDNFKKDAKAFLLEFAAQMPKGSLTRRALDDTGNERRGVRVSDIAGIVPDKFLGGLACKAGLWWAKKENKPVYYCLDGINMDDVTNYKKVKNKAIEDFLDGGGQPAKAAGHDEVVTLVELREILKNWDGLKDDEGKDTVKFVLTGAILKDAKLEAFVKKWRDAITTAKANRSPAPPRDEFANELKDLDPELMAGLQAGPEGD